MELQFFNLKQWNVDNWKKLFRYTYADQLKTIKLQWWGDLNQYLLFEWRLFVKNDTLVIFNLLLSEINSVWVCWNYWPSLAGKTPDALLPYWGCLLCSEIYSDLLSLFPLGKSQYSNVPPCFRSPRSWTNCRRTILQSNILEWCPGGSSKTPFLPSPERHISPLEDEKFYLTNNPKHGGIWQGFCLRNNSLLALPLLGHLWSDCPWNPSLVQNSL